VLCAAAEDKRRQVAMAEVLTDKWAGTGVTVVTMHPGELAA
jgi:hypothetical protein